MKLRPLIPEKQLRATAARRLAPSRATEDEYDEPTTKFSKAFVIVLVLHVVAFLGFYSFSSINAHRPAAPAADPLPMAPAAPVGKPAVAESAAADASAKKPAATIAATGPKDSGEVYTVLKGESPERIAKKLGVSYNDLMKLNHIDDPKKLQIGQKLHVPIKK